MDRFKFRAWDKEEKYYLKLDEDAVLGVCYKTKNEEWVTLFWAIENNNYIVEQSTGLKDKNGALIYEGDIVEYHGKYVVKYGQYDIEQASSSPHDSSCIHCDLLGFYLENDDNTMGMTDYVEITGNIHKGEKQ